MSVPKLSKMHQRVNQKRHPESQMGAASYDLSENRVWDQLIATEERLVHSAVEHATTIARVVDTVAQNPQTYRVNGTVEEIQQVATTLVGDCTALVSKVQELRSTHADKTGDAKGFDEVIAAQNIHTKVAELIGEFSVVFSAGQAVLNDILGVNDSLVLAATSIDPLLEKYRQDNPHIFQGGLPDCIKSPEQLAAEQALADPNVISEAVAVDRAAPAPTPFLERMVDAAIGPGADQFDFFTQPRAAEQQPQPTQE